MDGHQDEGHEMISRFDHGLGIQRDTSYVRFGIESLKR